MRLLPAESTTGGQSRWPLLLLLRPHRRLALSAVLLTAALAFWGVTVWRAGLPLWGATTVALAVAAVPVALKWRDDLTRYGVVVTGLGILLLVQGFHTVEHATQAVQFYLLALPPARSAGLLSSLNAEWVHFGWNWLVVAAVLLLMWGGMRNRWAWLLLFWAVAHSGEHSYLFVRYLQVREALLNFGLTEPEVAQALPGILGRDGWLARSGFCPLPGVTTFSRLAVHFWWNAGEILLLAVAGDRFLRRRLAAVPAPDHKKVE